MGIGIQQLTPVFAGEASGVDIARSLTKDEVAVVEAAMDRYAVLVFHDQTLTNPQQQVFSRNFGELEHTGGGNITKTQERRLDPYMADVSNLDKDHRPLARHTRTRMFNLGNRLWHSDSSFRAVPAKYSLLSGRMVVDHGGQTQFAYMRAAYDALDAATKAEIKDLV